MLVTDSLCPSQTFFGIHRNMSVFVTNSLCLSKTVYHTQFVLILGLVSHLFINDFHHNFSVRFEFVQNHDTLDIHFPDL